MTKPNAQIWIMYRRPAHFDDPKDWPAPFVARRWEIIDGKPHWTEDLLGADTFEELCAILPAGLEVIPRLEDDEATIIETRQFIPPEPEGLVILDDGRLESGMKAEEAVKRATAWWNKIGRRALNRSFNQERDPSKVLTGGPAPAVVIAGEVKDVLPSGILKGLPFSMLTRAEQVRVVKAWHFEHVVKPTLPAAAPGRMVLEPGPRH